MITTNIPLVSVVMITYKHEKFIQEAIEGILIQQCSFNIELIIADDCSPDTTFEVVNDLIKLYPNGHRIIYNKHKTNIGMMPNFIWALQQTKGKYIALCEGDDYWTDPLKLQKQVDFLEANEDYVLVSHSRILVDEKSFHLKNHPDFSEIGFHTQCILFRNIFQKDFLDFDFSKILNGDTFLMLYIENFGKFKILDFTGSAYRISHTGVWSLKDIDEKYIKSTKSLDEMLSFFENNNYLKSSKKVESYKIDNLIRYSNRLKEEKFYFKSFSYYLKYISMIIYKRKITLVNIKIAFKYFF